MRKALNRTPWVEGGKLVGIKLDGQGYRFDRVGFYRSEVSGNVIEVEYYLTECASCRTPTEVFVRSGADQFSPSRRCSDCARPLVPVKA